MFIAATGLVWSLAFESPVIAIGNILLPQSK